MRFPLRIVAIMGVEAGYGKGEGGMFLVLILRSVHFPHNLARSAVSGVT
jgi:hypothetical protein